MNIYIITAKDKQTALYAYDSAEKKCRLYRNGSLSAVISTDKKPFNESEVNRNKKGEFSNKTVRKTETEKLTGKKAEEWEAIKNIDFNKDNILPAMPKNDADLLKIGEKPVLLKKNIIERNRIRHPDLTDEDLKNIIWEAVYNREKIIEEPDPKKPNYRHFSSFVNGHNYLALIDLDARKENVEIVHCHIMSVKNFAKLVRKAITAGAAIWK